jgi:hypothetical protein
MKMKVEYKGKDQNWQEGTTTYWFELSGRDFGTACEFDAEMFGVCESGEESGILDCDGYPMTVGDRAEIAAKRHCIVTDEMRSE